MTENIKIMIADDNKIFCERLEQFLKADTDITIVGIVHNGPEALKMVEEKKPDILILDLLLSRLDGLGVLRELNKMSFRPKIIISTAVGQDDMVHEAIRLGIDYFILKPYELSFLTGQIRNMMDIGVTVTPQVPATRNYDAKVTSILHHLGMPENCQ